jgi:glucose-1-phosphate adenylyltransferase
MLRSMARNPVQVATIVLAGGKGERLLPLTLHHSKPAVSYGGRYRLIDIPISNSINSGFRQIFVIAQYLSAELQHHVTQTYQFDHFNQGTVDVLTPQEDEAGTKQWFEGTADAVRKNLPTILKSTADYFLILSGDQLYNIDFQQMVESAESCGADLMIASIPVPQKEATRMGLLKIDGAHRVLEFCEKPKEEALLKRFLFRDSQHYLGSMGIYVFKREVLIDLLTRDPRNDFGFHLIDTAVKRHKTFAFLYRGYWEDIGTIASYYEANLMLTREKEGLDTYDEKNPIYSRLTHLPGPKIYSTHVSKSIICEGSIIEAKEISNSIIGLRSRVHHGTIIRNSIMMGNHFYMPPLLLDAAIGENCLIEKAIIDEHVRIGNNVKLINQNKLGQYDDHGIAIRDGIIIVSAGTEIPDGFVL